MLISFAVGVNFLIQYSRPVDLLSEGLENLKDKDFSMKLLPTGYKDTDQLVRVYNKMIDQLRSERIKQRETNLFLDKLIDASPSGIIILDYDEKIASVNPAVLSMTKLEETDMIGFKLDQILHPLISELLHLSEKEIVIVELSAYETYQCSKASFIDKGYKHYFIIIESLKDALINAERKAYGKIIRLMSHELNNTVGAVNSILESLLTFENMITSSLQIQYSKIINIAIQRNEHLNDFMSGFADVVKIPEPRLKSFDINPLLQNQILLISQYFGEKRITVKVDLTNRPCMIMADESQIEQVVFNILKNAVEAIEQKGELQIKVNMFEHAELIISNNGEQIKSEIENHLFTPFYSSKKNGQGLGLTLIRTILTNHGFSYSLSTGDDGITRFVIDLCKKIN